MNESTFVKLSATVFMIVLTVQRLDFYHAVATPP